MTENCELITLKNTSVTDFEQSTTVINTYIFLSERDTG
jgi:hypothetical protein